MSLELSPNVFGSLLWRKNWAGPWSFLSSTYLGYQYTKQLQEELHDSLEVCLFISREGYTSAYFYTDDQQRFGSALASRIAADEEEATRWCSEIRRRTDAVLGLINELKTGVVDLPGFRRFIQAMYAYGVPHRAIKVGVDYLPAEVLARVLPELTEARLYAEPVYAETENFMKFFADQLSSRVGISSEYLLCTTREEFEQGVESGSFPTMTVLEARHRDAAILFRDGEYLIVTGSEVQALEQAMEVAAQSNDVLKGTTAFPGSVRGTARVILDPTQQVEFYEGDILVTGMTRPEYLPLVKKSAAFVTDAGGMLSHAAITARELQKPCVVGTQVASKTIHTGDELEVDADAGVVRILHRVS